MRYYAFFISTNDNTIMFKRPGAINVSIKPEMFNIEHYKKIPLEHISSLTIEHQVSDTELSAGKALGGAIIGGGVGMAIGAVMGGRKVKSVITVTYSNENGEVCTCLIECANGFKVMENFDKYRALLQTKPQTSMQPHIRPPSMTFKQGLIIYFTWPYTLYKWLKNKKSNRT